MTRHHEVRSKSNHDATPATPSVSAAETGMGRGVAPDDDDDVRRRLSNSLATLGRSGIDPVDDANAADAAGVGMPPSSGLCVTATVDANPGYAVADVELDAVVVAKDG